MSAHTLILVGCVAQKGARPAAAHKLYRGQLFTARKGYAERRASSPGVRWAVLSAYYGVVVPERVIDPYELRLSSLGDDAWDSLVSQVGHHIGQMVAAGGTVEVHAGATYVDLVECAAVEAGYTIATPVKGLQIGEQLAYYKAHAGDEVGQRTLLDDSLFCVLEAVDGPDGSQLVPRPTKSVGRGDMVQLGGYWHTVQASRWFDAPLHTLELLTTCQRYVKDPLRPDVSAEADGDHGRDRSMFHAVGGAAQVEPPHVTCPDCWDRLVRAGVSTMRDTAVVYLPGGAVTVETVFHKWAPKGPHPVPPRAPATVKDLVRLRRGHGVPVETEGPRRKVFCSFPICPGRKDGQPYRTKRAAGPCSTVPECKSLASCDHRFGSCPSCGEALTWKPRRSAQRSVERRPSYLADARTCRACGCTDMDCSGCIERTGQPCSWVEADLCSACDVGTNDVELDAPSLGRCARCGDVDPANCTACSPTVESLLSQPLPIRQADGKCARCGFDYPANAVGSLCASCCSRPERALIVQMERALRADTAAVRQVAHDVRQRLAQLSRQLGAVADDLDDASDPIVNACDDFSMDSVAIIDALTRLINDCMAVELGDDDGPPWLVDEAGGPTAAPPGRGSSPGEARATP